MATDPSPPPHLEGLHLRLSARLRAYFLAGILVTAPISITIYLAWQFVHVVDATMAPLIPWGVPGFGLVVVVAGLTLIGALTAGFAGRLVVRVSESVLAHMPVIRSIYAAVKQIFETVLAQKTNAFREVVLIEYPRPGIWTLGFITGTASGEIRDAFAEEMVNVFVPTTPNPTSGFLLFVPRSDMRVLEMTVEEGIKMVVSTGIITPVAKVGSAGQRPMNGKPVKSSWR